MRERGNRCEFQCRQRLVTCGDGPTGGGRTQVRRTVMSSDGEWSTANAKVKEIKERERDERERDNGVARMMLSRGMVVAQSRWVGEWERRERLGGIGATVGN